MWRTRAVGWLGRRYEVEEDELQVASFEFTGWSEHAELTLGPRALAVRRTGFWRPRYALLETKTELASARPTGAWRRGYDIQHGEEEYTLVPGSFLGRDFDLRLRGRELGSVRPEGWFGRRALVELDAELAPELRLFATWLVILAWRRAATAAAAS